MSTVTYKPIVGNRDLFAKLALDNIPKILTLLDRNPHSPTYGCFDRNFWHYKIIDFPSGMAQEFVWPLALAYHLPCPFNNFYQQPAVKNWAEAAIRYASISAHDDGSCDDYYPHERAVGAAAFSLLAFIESYQLLNLQDEMLINFLEKRARWLAATRESGRLANHEALVILCLEKMIRLTNDDRWRKQKEHRMERLFGWQTEEGWFYEYEGFDPGYHTLTLSLLSQLLILSPDERLKQALEKGASLALQFIHPDGSFGGEYGSRNTYNFFPHGFELIGRWMPEALSVNDRFLEGIASGLRPCYEDDHTIGHHTWNYLLAWSDYVEARPESQPPLESIWLKDAGILIDRRDDLVLYVGLNKGGVFKLFRRAKLLASDTQISLLFQNPHVGNAVAHLIAPCQVRVDESSITIEGSFYRVKHTQMTTTRLLLLRILMSTAGRFFPNVIRKMMQKLLITAKEKAPARFVRSFHWINGACEVTDEVWVDDWKQILAAVIGIDQTSIYVATSRTFQAGQMKETIDLTRQVRSLQPGESLRVVRTY